MGAPSPAPAVAPVPDDPNAGRASARSTKLAIGLGTMLGLLCFASALAWVFGDTTDLREAVESTPVNQQTLDDSDMTREEFDDLLVVVSRFGFGGLQLIIAILFGVFSSMLSRLRPTGRTGLFVLGLLGLLGSLLLDQLNGLAVVLGLAASGGLIVSTMLPTTRQDLKRREQALFQSALAAGAPMGNAPFPMPGQGYTPGQMPPTQPWSGPQQGYPPNQGHPNQAYPPNQGYPPQPVPQQYPPQQPPAQQPQPQAQPQQPQQQQEQPAQPATYPPGQPQQPQTAYVPEQPPWADASTADPVPAPARVAPTGTEIPAPEGEPPAHDAKWDPVRGAYTRWEPARSIWVRHNPESGDWDPLD